MTKDDVDRDTTMTSSSDGEIVNGIATSAEDLTEQVMPHLKTTAYFAFGFVVAWSWYLAVLGTSHALIGQSPIQDQLSFGDNPGPKRIVVLLLEYLLVCGGSALLSHVVQKTWPGRRWTIGTFQHSITTVEH